MPRRDLGFVLIFLQTNIFIVGGVLSYNYKQDGIDPLKFLKDRRVIRIYNK